MYLLAAASAADLSTSARGQSTLIPITARRDMVFDHSGLNLYISTSNGVIFTYNLITQTFGVPYVVGGILNGIDIARDDSFLLVAQENVNGSQGTFERVALPTGLVTHINYDLDFHEAGAWDVAIGSNGLALATTRYSGSGWVPLRQIDLATNTVSIRYDSSAFGAYGEVTQDTQIQRSADGTRLFFLQSNISNGPIFTYSATTNSFGPRTELYVFNDFTSAAVSRDGSLLVTRSWFNPATLTTAPNFQVVHSFTGIDSGVAFDATSDTFYGVNTQTSEIIAYDTNTFAEKFRLPIGEDLNQQRAVDMFDTGTLVASPDGRYLALETPMGIRLFSVSQGPNPLALSVTPHRPPLP